MAKSKAKQALEFVRELAPKCETATDLHNAFWGNGGKLGQLFTTQDERKAFMKTPEYKQIAKIWESLPWYWDEREPKKRTKRRSVKR
jgi:hypothetical protein